MTQLRECLSFYARKLHSTSRSSVRGYAVRSGEVCWRWEVERWHDAYRSTFARNPNDRTFFRPCVRPSPRPRPGGAPRSLGGHQALDAGAEPSLLCRSLWTVPELGCKSRPPYATE